MNLLPLGCPPQLITLEVMGGDFDEGFSVTVKISQAGRSPRQVIAGELPAAPSLPRLYRAWQAHYYPLERQRIILPPTQVTNVSTAGDNLEQLAACRRAADALALALENWFNQADLLRLQMAIQGAITPEQSAQLILKTDNAQLRRLPWHLWELFDHYPKLSWTLQAEQVPAAKQQLKSPVRLLAVLGCADNLDLQRDREVLEQLPRTQLTLLQQPSRQVFNETLWAQPWDILFFAGHSSNLGAHQLGEGQPPHSPHPGDGQNRNPNPEWKADYDGEIQLNERDTLSLSDLRYALRQAVRRGLKLAVFNSCDGLGLAQSLAPLKIPYLVVMREPIPDTVAQTFLRYFLESFTQRMPLHLALRTAREKLQGIEARYPSASWLPVLYQHPSAPSLRWPSPWSKLRIGTALVGGLGAIALALLLKPTPSPPPPANLAERYSLGEKALVTKGLNGFKTDGIAAFAKQDYEGAIAAFRQALDYDSNDPETRIYLNNALAAQQPKRLRVAAGIPIGGNLTIAEEMLRGIAQAQEDINRQALEQPGQALLEIQIVNDDNDVELVQEIAQNLSQSPNILAVIGHNASETSLAAAPIYQAHQLVAISPTSGATELSDLGSYIFRTVPSVREDSRQLANYAFERSREQRHGQRFALCSDEKSPYSLTFNREFREAVQARGGLISSVPCNFSDPNFNSGRFVSGAIADGVDALLLNPSVQRISQAIDLAGQVKHRMDLYGGSTMATLETLQQGRENVSGMVIPVAWNELAGTNSDFLATAQRFWGQEISWRSATAFDATQAIYSGLLLQPSRQGLQRALADETFSAQGATGKVSFQKSGDRRPSDGIGLLVQVEPDPDAASGYRFSPVPLPEAWFDRGANAQ